MEVCRGHLPLPMGEVASPQAMTERGRRWDGCECLQICNRVDLSVSFADSSPVQESQVGAVGIWKPSVGAGLDPPAWGRSNRTSRASSLCISFAKENQRFCGRLKSLPYGCGVERESPKSGGLTPSQSAALTAPPQGGAWRALPAADEASQSEWQRSK